jgi:hypothetical protein
MRRRTFIFSLSLLAAGCASRLTPPAGRLDAATFELLLEGLADAWNRGDARAAADCFTPDAIYVEPPQKQVYRGRDSLFRFFGGDAGRAGAMSMSWHRFAFDPTLQAGMAEFTFRYGTQVHGVVVVDTRDRLISQWREYWYASELAFDEFVAPSAPK